MHHAGSFVMASRLSSCGMRVQQQKAWLPVACGILVPRPGTEPVSPALQGIHLNHWTTREVLIPAPLGPQVRTTHAKALLVWRSCDKGIMVSPLPFRVQRGVHPACSWAGASSHSRLGYLLRSCDGPGGGHLQLTCLPYPIPFPSVC